ncbi:MAG: DUF1631 domain-containing protein [Gammaproteobacteria bacterium]|nr:DUF1631 domain-containing protein [Gammaproteobacteria bacterium]
MTEKEQITPPAINNNFLDDPISDPDYISKVINQFILNEDKKPTNGNTVKSTGSQHYNREHVIDALTRLQVIFKPKYVPGQTININTNEFKSALINSIAKLDKVSIPKSMNQIDSRTIDFVEMIFGAFLRDKNISHAIKNLLLQLQIPIIKVALLDKNLFNKENHPARHVLNSIAHLGIGIEDSENTIYKTMQYIIEQLLQSFDKNIDAFNTAMASLSRLTSIEKNKHEKTEKQTQQLIKVEYSRQLVLKELQYYTLQIKIPEPIQPLILSHWSTLMYNRLINYGKDSIEWREAVGILRLLVKSLRPIETKEDWIALRSIYKGIVNSIRSCLDDSRQNKEKTFMATSNLNNFYFKKISESRFFSENCNDDESNKDNNSKDGTYNILDCFNDKDFDDIELSPIEKKAIDAKKIIDKMPSLIKAGKWFEVFTDYNHPVRRLKLSVIVDEEAKLIFVDYMGNKVIEKDLKTFITELNNDQSRLINDHSIFEYALSMVIISIAARN